VVDRVGVRCLGSIVPEVKLNDFGVKNEPVPGVPEGVEGAPGVGERAQEDGVDDGGGGRS
jgi:hypothetical protein